MSLFRVKATCIVFSCLLVLVCLGAAQADTAPVDYVNPLIDTVKSRWFFFNSATRPFGMVNLSPDTDVDGSWKSGYLYDSKAIRCFSHIHAWQMSGVPAMPGVGEIKAHLGFDANKATFSHDDEVVKPGYHKVVLSDRNIEVELTATTRVGFHRYMFPESGSSHIAFNLDEVLGHGGMRGSKINPVSKTEVEGSVVMAPTNRRKKPCTVYFAIALNKPFKELMAWDKKEIMNLSDIKGENPGFYIEFPTDQDETVLMKVALSYVSEAQAWKNMKAECDHWDFDKVAEDARTEWNDLLSKIKVEGGTEKQRIKFYSDLWHAMQGRRIMSDVDGQYIDNTGEQPAVKQVRLGDDGKPLFPHYNHDAWWGSQWSLNILWSLVYPEILDGFCSTAIDMYENGGLIPRGPSGGNYTFVMIGDTAAPAIACAYVKGIRNWDTEKGFEGLKKNAFPGGIRDHAGYEAGGRRPAAGGGMKYYVDRNYVPLHRDGSGGHREGAAQTLEYAYQDWCIAQYAKAMGKEDDYEFFMKRSQNYRHVFDKDAGEVLKPEDGFDTSVGWMRPREKDGSWYKDFYPIGKGFNCKGFVESNGAIYTWFVPQDYAGLAELMGGKDKAVAKLNHQFELATEARFIASHGSHSESWVDYENQPATGMGHIFNHLGAPWLTQKWIREVKEVAFGDITPYGGYNGDEDQGQMGALGVLMAIGIFDSQGGAAYKPNYDLTSPVFDKITISLDQKYYPGKEITIVCTNNSPENMYIQSAKINGKEWNSFQIPHDTFVGGSTVELELGPGPNKQWGVQ